MHVIDSLTLHLQAKTGYVWKPFFCDMIFGKIWTVRNIRMATEDGSFRVTAGFSMFVEIQMSVGLCKGFTYIITCII